MISFSMILQDCAPGYSDFYADGDSPVSVDQRGLLHSHDTRRNDAVASGGCGKKV